MNEGIMTAVQTLGIQVVLCLLMAWFVKYMFDRFLKLLEEEKDEHKKEVAGLQEAINNNTLVMTKLLERLGDREDNAVRD